MVTVYGIPTCDTVRRARAWLSARGLPFTDSNLRADPPDRARVARWVETFGNKALRNTAGGSYRALPADRESWSDERWIDAFAQDPMLIKRPVFERDGVPVLVGFTASEDELARRLGG